MSTAAFDVVVAGAGIVGAACADALSAEGLKVAVVEASTPGTGATAAGMGHVVVMDDSEAQFALTRYSAELWRTLAPDLPAAAEYAACGTIWIAADDEEMAEVARKRAFFAERGVAAEVLDSRAVAELEPSLRKGLAGGLLVPGDSVIYPPCATRFLLDRVRVRGGSVIAGRKVTRFTEGRATLDDGTSLEAKWVINATAVAASDLTPGLDIQPRKGHLLITDRYPGFVRHQLVELGYLKSAHSTGADSVAFNAQPRVTGQVLIGSSRQLGVTAPQVETGMLRRMLRRAAEYMPALEGLSAIRAWTGFRACTPDNLPYIGRAKGFERVLVAAGHEGLGITTSLGTARLVADEILGRPSAIPREPYSPERVIERRHE